MEAYYLYRLRFFQKCFEFFDLLDGALTSMVLTKIGCNVAWINGVILGPGNNFCKASFLVKNGGVRTKLGKEDLTHFRKFSGLERSC